MEVFHAGTARRDGEIVSNGGRVSNVTATAPELKSVPTHAYHAIELIDRPEGLYRKDIGWRAL